MADTEEIFIGRQPILDRQQQLFAYELLFRSGRKNQANVHFDLAASASVISHAFGDLGIEQALGPYKGFLNCDEALLLSDNLEILPPGKIVLEILETVDITPIIVERCRELKARGFTLALDDFVNFEDKYRPLLDVVAIVKVDLMPLDAAALGRTTQALKRWPLHLLAEKVDSREQAQHCHDLGYAYFQGYYFAKPVIIAGRKLTQSQLALLQLLGLVLDDAESTELERLLKKEPGMTMNLMRLTNSVATGVPTHVTSLRHAITVLGRRQLQRWLQLLLYTNPSGDRTPSPLLLLAATRGRLMELLTARLYPDQHETLDRAFMTGILSLMPALMGVAMEELLQGLNVVADVQRALILHEGSLGTLLELTEALEASDAIACGHLIDRLTGIDYAMVNACLTQALGWSASIAQASAD
jgi:EAL and modified HD-GYP domain-containing signal transduction protein